MHMYLLILNFRIMFLNKFIVVPLAQKFSVCSSIMTNDRIKTNLVWVDLEMTGLNVEHDRILEIACIVTDADLHIIAEGPNLVIHEPESILRNMNEWCIAQHGKSGLTEAVRKSQLSLIEAENLVLSFIKKHTLANTNPLAGNTVHMDKKFLEKYMPRLAGHLHYRIVDVSTVKELCKRWFPDVQFPKQGSHRAIDDIRESIEELKFYRKAVFKS